MTRNVKGRVPTEDRGNENDPNELCKIKSTEWMYEDVRDEDVLRRFVST